VRLLLADARPGVNPRHLVGVLTSEIDACVVASLTHFTLSGDRREMSTARLPIKHVEDAGLRVAERHAVVACPVGEANGGSLRAALHSRR
jgi:hypothetical protein